MAYENALAVYKNKPALIKEKSADKILIQMPDGDQIKVREKDIEIIHPGPVKNFSGIDSANGGTSGATRDAWELLLADQVDSFSIKDLAELVFEEYSPASAWAAYSLLLDGLYFTGTASAVRSRP